MTVIAMPNRISLQFTDEEIQQIDGAVAVLQTVLLAKLTDLDSQEVIGMTKMGPRTVDSVTATYEHLRLRPDLCPNFIDLKEVGIDLEGVKRLQVWAPPLEQISHAVADSMVLCGSEAAVAMLAAYKSVKAAAAVGVPGAALIAEDIGRRMPARGRKAAAPAAADKAKAKPSAEGD